MLGFLFFIHFVISLFGAELLFATSLLRKVVALIGLFLNLALLLFVLQLELLGLVLVIVYVGAVAVLFLFVVMLYSFFGGLHVPVSWLSNGLVLGMFSVLFMWIVDFGVFCDFKALNGSGFGLVEQCVDFEYEYVLLNLGQIFWSEWLLVVVVSTILLLVGVIGSVRLTRGLVSSKLRRRGLFVYKGALTNKPYSFKARAWELTSLRTYDLFDSSLSAVFVEVRGLEIMRIVPTELGMPFFPWISDKSRFFFDSLRYQRVVSPIIVVRGKQTMFSWERVSLIVKEVLDRFGVEQFGVFEKRSSSLLSVGIPFYGGIDSLLSLRQFGYCLGSVVFFYGKETSTTFFKEHVNSFFSVEDFLRFGKQNRQVIFLLGTDLRFELPRLNIVCRFLIKLNMLKLFGVGLGTLGLSNYNVNNLGIGSETFMELFEGRHACLNLVRRFSPAKNLVLLGRSFRSSVSYRNVSSIFGSWVLNFRADLVSLYSDVCSLVGRFIGLFAGGRRYFTKKREVSKLGLVFNHNNVGSGGFDSSDISFISFLSEVGGLKTEVRCFLPLTTMLEQEAELFVGLDGVVRQVSSISTSGFLENSIVFRSTKRVGFFLSTIVGLGVRFGYFWKFVVDQSGSSPYGLGSWLVSNNPKTPFKLKRWVNKLFVNNFFQTDALTRNSKLLRSGSLQFYSNICLYD